MNSAHKRRCLTNQMQCELCAQSTDNHRLCQPCLEMIARLQRIWPKLDLVSRGVMYYHAMDVEKQRGLRAAAGKEC